jgi:hypothetical protein
MARHFKLALLSTFLLIVWGCGGTGANNPFAGTWTGTWSEPSNGSETGTWSVTVSSTGLLLGSATNSAADHVGLTGSITGSVDSGGNLSNTTTCTYAGFAPTTLTGQLKFTTDADTAISSTLTENVPNASGGTNYSMTLNLTKQ